MIIRCSAVINATQLHSLIFRHWPEAALASVGILALGVLFLIPFHGTLNLDIAAPWRTQTIRPAAAVGPKPQRQAFRDIPGLLKEVRAGTDGAGWAVRALTSLAADNIASLIPLLEDRDVRIRLVAARAVAYLTGHLEPQPVALIPPLVRRLHDHSPDVRQAAVLALLNFGTGREAAIPALIDQLHDEGLMAPADVFCLQMGAVDLLGRIGPQAKPAIPELNRILHDSTSGVRAAAATALWRISCNTNLVFPPLAAMLTETNWNAKMQARAALQRIGREVELPAELVGQLRAEMARHPMLDLAESP